MSVAYVIEFHVKTEQRERFLRLLTDLLHTMRVEATYVDATLHVNPDDPCHFLLHEVWQDHDDVLTVQLQRPYRQAWHAALPELLSGDRQISIWTPMGETRQLE